MLFYLIIIIDNIVHMMRHMTILRSKVALIHINAKKIVTNHQDDSMTDDVAHT